MQKFLKEYLEGLNEQREKRRKARIAKLLLVVLVIGAVAGILSQYGVAMTDAEKCGLAEHEHNGACYENTLVCGLKETEGHKHTDSCYETTTVLTCGLDETDGHQHGRDCYDEEGKLVCGKKEIEAHHHDDSCYTEERTLVCREKSGEGHTHTDACYERKLVCGMEEHRHTAACYIDKTVDVEDASEWDAMYENTEWRDTWNDNLVIAAEKQLGYQESEANYEVAEDGSHKGYTRYGAFCEDDYCDWDAAFVNFCMHYAGEDDINIEASKMFPGEADTEKWLEEFIKADKNNESFLVKLEDYEPKAGDLVFFDGEDEELPVRMGIVSSYDTETNEVEVIEGNSENEVKKNRYSADDDRITACLKLAEVEEAYKDSDNEEGKAVEPETSKLSADEEEDWAYEESYDAEQVVIRVKAKEGVVPKGAKLSVTPIEQKKVTKDMTEEEAAETEKVNEQYELTNQKLEEESERRDAKLEGFLAYDICFIVNGEEVEPSGEVKVTMDFKEAVVPETVSDDSVITVSHLKETEDSEIEVEDLIEKDAAIIETTEEGVSVEKVELVVDSFSIVSISWSLNGTQMGYIDVRHYNEEGQQLSVEGDSVSFPVSGASPSEFLLQDLLGWEEISVDGRRYQPKRIEVYNKNLPPGSDNQWQVNKIVVNMSQFIYSFYNEDALVASCSPADLSLYELHITYEDVGTSNTNDLKIINNIETTGNLDVSLTGEALERYEEAVAGNSDEKEIKYVWYKRVNSKAEEDFQKVENQEFSNGTFKITGDYGNSLNVALDEGSLREGLRDSVEYKVELWIDDEMIATSVAESILYYNEVRNGSFEKPELERKSGDGTFNYYNAGEVEGWETTAPGNEIEIANIGGNGTIHNQYGFGTLSFAGTIDGTQFAELNAAAVGSLYQDVLVAKGTMMNYSFRHRARANTSELKNKMYLVIIPTFVAKKGIVNTDFKRSDTTQEIDTQNEVEYLIQHINDIDPNTGERLYPGAYVKEYEADKSKWTENEGIYIPEYDLNRFYFVSAVKDPTMGNFLDKVWFSQDLPEPKPDAFTFQLTKNISGIEDEQKLEELMENIQFNISAKDKDGKPFDLPCDEVITGKKMDWRKLPGSDTYIGVYNMPDVSMKDDEYVITVVEDSTSAAVDSYNLNVSATGKITKGGTTTEAGTYNGYKGEITVAKSTVAEMTFNNVYSEDNGFSLTMEKRSASTKKPLDGAEFTLTKEDGSKEVLTGVSDKSGCITEWKNEKDEVVNVSTLNGSYVLKEIKAPEGYFSVENSNTWLLEFKNGKLYTESLKEAIKGQEGIITLTEDLEAKTCTITVYNNLMYSLPSAGGSGIYCYMFGGVLLMLAASLLAYKNKHKEVLRS